ncbi:hypothetical protein EDB84DRAFT_794408 [Lactarius hengduanensis]|nr:hypothetical protein EDB84DRAFT_794408 [Lactarius hengduanensis]
MVAWGKSGIPMHRASHVCLVICVSAGYFTFGTKEDVAFARERYVNETRKLYGVLEIRLSQDRDYLAGPGRGKLTVADFSLFPWIAGHARTISKTVCVYSPCWQCGRQHNLIIEDVAAAAQWAN